MLKVNLQTPSKIFLTFWLTLLAGMAVGRYYRIDTQLLGSLLAVWLVVLLSGHKPAIELVATIVIGFSCGYLLWQISDGELWLRLSWLTFMSHQLTNLREFLASLISLGLGEPHNSLLIGILLGSKSQLDKDLLTIFRTVGLTHLIAVSGYNLTVIGQNIETAFSPLIGRKSIYPSISIIALFIILTGAPASVLRAGVMAGLMALGTILGRPTQSINFLVIGSGLLAIFEPKIIFDIGFQLSVAATYGLVRVSSLISPLFERWPGPKVLYGILAETLGATITTVPIIAYYFGQITPIVLISNLLVLPLIPLTMALGSLGLGASLLSTKLASLAFLPVWPLLNWTIYSATRLSSLSWASEQLVLNLPIAVSSLILILIGVELLSLKYQRK